MTNYRVRFVIDEDASFEESNGEARPMTAQEYRGNEYRACPNHPRGDKSSDTQENGIGTCGTCGHVYEDVPYDEYRAYYGNPDRHVYIGYEVQEQCHCCGAWKATDSLWHIDMMDDSPEFHRVSLGTWYELTAPEITGYFRDLMNDIGVK